MGTMHEEQVQLVMGELRTELEYFKYKMLLMQAHENRVAVDEEQLLFIAEMMCLRKYRLDSRRLGQILLQGLYYDSDILSKVHDHDHYQDVVCEHHEYVKDNVIQVVPSNVSTVPNDAYMIILNDMHEPPPQHVSVPTQNKVVDKSLTAELVTYKEQVDLYERRARFELTKRKQKIDEQLKIVITHRNIKEENLKKELHTVKMQLASTINHNKSMVEEVMSLKKDFKQKENKYIGEFLDMKALQE
nr:hypothetical protein [Tanacetum cinerariifolium]